MNTPPHRDEIKAELRRAEKSIRAARLLFEDDLLEDALSRTFLKTIKKFLKAIE